MLALSEESKSSRSKLKIKPQKCILMYVICTVTLNQHTLDKLKICCGKVPKCIDVILYNA